MSIKEARRLLAGRYHLEGRLGQGVHAVVYGATDLRLRRPVTVKMLRSEWATDPELRDRFKLEARTAAGLSHPNVVAIHDTGDEDGIDYLVMEHLPGTTLADELRDGPVSEARVTEVGRQVLAGLAAAHAVGIVHGALRPGNVITCANGSVKLVDFGGAASTGTGPAVAGGALTPGTLARQAPERRDGEPASPAGDLYGVGAVLYECLVGRPPFGGGSTAALVASIQGGGPVPIRALRPAADPALAAVVERALDPHPDRRFASALAMSGALLGRLVPVTSTHPGPTAELTVGTAAGRRIPAAATSRAVPQGSGHGLGPATPPAPHHPVPVGTSHLATPRPVVPAVPARREPPAAVLLPAGSISVPVRPPADGGTAAPARRAGSTVRTGAPSPRSRGALPKAMASIEGHFVLLAVLAGAVVMSGLLVAALVGTSPSAPLKSRAAGSRGGRPTASAPAGKSAVPPVSQPSLGSGSLPVARTQHRTVSPRQKTAALVSSRSPRSPSGHKHRAPARPHRPSAHRHHRPPAHRHHPPPAHRHHRPPAHRHHQPAARHHHRPAARQPKHARRNRHEHHRRNRDDRHRRRHHRPHHRRRPYFYFSVLLHFFF